MRQASVAQAVEQRRIPRPAILAILLFVVAVLLGRLLLEGGWAWMVFAVVVPLLVLAGASRVGWRVASALATFFTAIVLLARWIQLRFGIGWIVMLLLLVVGFTAMLAGRVVAQMHHDRKAAKTLARAHGSEPAGDGRPLDDDEK